MQLPVDKKPSGLGSNATGRNDIMTLAKRGKGVSKMNIADRIQVLRKTKGISQEDLADKVGVSRQAVSKWESEQSIPDLDKVIIMSEFFGVTTDYILKGIEPTRQTESKDFTSQILYIASTAFIAIGLLCAFGGWYEEPTAETIWGSMIIQVVGAASYFIGKLISPSKTPAPFIINLLNIVLALFIPISLIVTSVFNKAVAPYPTGSQSLIVFTVAYILAIILTVAVLKKRAK